MKARFQTKSQMVRLVGVVVLLTLFAPEKVHAQQNLGHCTLQHDEGVLHLMGDDDANTVDIAGTEEGVRVACDGETNTFTELTKIVVVAGAGDDRTLIDRSSCDADEIAVEIYGQDGDDSNSLLSCPNPPSENPLFEKIVFSGGPGADTSIVFWDPIFAAIVPGGFVDARAATVMRDEGIDVVVSTQTEKLIVYGEASDNEILVDNLECRLNQITIEIFLQDGDDSATVTPCPNAPSDPFYEPPTVVGGPGADIVKILNKAQQFPPPEPVVLKIVAEPAEPAPLLEFATSSVRVGEVEILRISRFEDLRLEDGPDDGQIIVDNTTGRLPSLAISGQGGDDEITLLLPTGSTDAVREILFSGGSGADKFSAVGHSDDENYELTGIPDLTIPDPHILVTERVTGVTTGNVFVQETETIRLETGHGDDHVDVVWDADSWSGLTLLQPILGDGDDSLNFNSQPVANELGDVQPFALDVEGGGGDDVVTITHGAGSWLDLSVTTNLGTGNDSFAGVVDPSPSDTVTGLEEQHSAKFEVMAGEGEDSVIIHSRLRDDLITLNIKALLGDGEDLLVALGEMSMLAEPGRGDDTARVSRNLLRYVTTFEEVEILE